MKLKDESYSNNRSMQIPIGPGSEASGILIDMIMISIFNNPWILVSHVMPPPKLRFDDFTCHAWAEKKSCRTDWPWHEAPPRCRRFQAESNLLPGRERPPYCRTICLNSTEINVSDKCFTILVKAAIIWVMQVNFRVSFCLPRSVEGSPVLLWHEGPLVSPRIFFPDNYLSAYGRAN